MPKDEDALTSLTRTLQRRAEDAEDKNTKQLFQEVRDELRKLNEHLGGTTEEHEQEAWYEDMAKKYPAMKSRPPRRRRAS